MLRTLPTKLKTFVPVLVGVPKPENHLPPRAMMTGMLHHVSTLFMEVGRP